MSSSTSTSFFPWELVRVTSNAVPVISCPVAALVNRIFKSISTDSKFTLTCTFSSSDDSVVYTTSSISIELSSAAFNLASAIASKPLSPTMPTLLSSVPTGTIAWICSSIFLLASTILPATIAPTSNTTPVQTRITSNGVRLCTNSRITSVVADQSKDFLP